MTYRLKYRVAGSVDTKQLVFTDSFGRFLMEEAPQQVRLLMSQMLHAQSWDYVANGRWIVQKNDGYPTINYFSIRRGDDPVVSYLPYGKTQELTPSGSWVRAGRQTMKPGRWLRAVFTDECLRAFNITDSIIETFSNKVKAYCDGEGVNMRLVRGEDIRYWYSGDNYASSAGTLGNSCMRYDRAQGYLDIYVNNPNCSMLIATNEDNLLIGRALVWQNVHVVGKSETYPYERVNTPFDQTFMDRIYTLYDYQQEMFLTYAEDHGWWRKQHQTYDTPESLVHPDGRRFKAKVEVKTGMTQKCRNYPYVDTLFNIKTDWSAMSNRTYTTRRGGDHYKMRDTYGGLDGYVDRTGRVLTQLDGWVREGSVYTCALCGRTGSNSHAQYPIVNGQSDALADERWCPDCLNNRYVFITSRLKWLPRDECVQARTNNYYNQQWEHKDDCVFSKWHNGWILKTQAIWLDYEQDWSGVWASRVRSERYKSYLSSGRAVYVPEIGDYVPYMEYDKVMAEIAAEKAAKEAAGEAESASPEEAQRLLEMELHLRRVADASLVEIEF